MCVTTFPVLYRLYQELRESVESQLIKDGKEGAEMVGSRKSSALGALQNQLAAISKVCTLKDIV